MLRYFSIIALVVATGCVPTKKSDQTPKIIIAEWNNWAGGIEGIGGVKYSVKLVAQISDNLRIDSLIIDEKAFLIDSDKLMSERVGEWELIGNAMIFDRKTGKRIPAP